MGSGRCYCKTISSTALVRLIEREFESIKIRSSNFFSGNKCLGFDLNCQFRVDILNLQTDVMVMFGSKFD